MSSCKTAPDSDYERFRQEYERDNGQTSPSGEDVYQTITIPASMNVTMTDEAGIRALLSCGTGILYLGFPECPWCRTLVPVLIEAMKSTEYPGELYYYNARQDRANLSRKPDGSITTECEGSALYKFLLDTLDEYLGPYEGLDEPNIKRIYFPTTVFVKCGCIASVHLNTLDSQEDGYEPLNADQHLAFFDKFKAEISAIM
ncbi:hypothetical protein AGMMS49992_05970 [Clostridia bacterium]|nr:hypothetical protein AGMMS49992_05970 [Clostridia bacterium]